MNERRCLLRTRQLCKYFKEPAPLRFFSQRGNVLKAVDQLDMEIYQDETVGLVGESGCGKSSFGKTLINLYKPTSGSVFYDGHDLQKLKKKELRKISLKMQMVFQDPYSSLNPRMSIGNILEEPLAYHRIVPPGERKKAVVDLLEKVGLSAADAGKYPHEFSGGQRQRIAIARALAVQPNLLICDEAVSALDISIQAQILNLFRDLKKSMNLSYLFISHDLSVVRHISDRIYVMYLGKIVEQAEKTVLFRHPGHPYTRALLSAMPKAEVGKKPQPLALIGEAAGSPPSCGCAFYSRCPFRQDSCRISPSELIQIEPGHFVRCLRYREI